MHTRTECCTPAPCTLQLLWPATVAVPATTHAQHIAHRGQMSSSQSADHPTRRDRRIMGWWAWVVAASAQRRSVCCSRACATTWPCRTQTSRVPVRGEACEVCQLGSGGHAGRTAGVRCGRRGRLLPRTSMSEPKPCPRAAARVRAPHTQRASPHICPQITASAAALPARRATHTRVLGSAACAARSSSRGSVPPTAHSQPAGRLRRRLDLEGRLSACRPGGHAAAAAATPTSTAADGSGGRTAGHTLTAVLTHLHHGCEVYGRVVEPHEQGGLGLGCAALGPFPSHGRVRTCTLESTHPENARRGPFWPRSVSRSLGRVPGESIDQQSCSGVCSTPPTQLGCTDNSAATPWGRPPVFRSVHTF